VSKAARDRQRSARERIAAQRAAARRAEARRRVLIAGGAVLAVVAVVVTLVVVKVSGGTPSQSAGSASSTVLPASVQRDVTTVPAATLESVGGGSARSFNPNPVKPVSGAPLTAGGKPEMLYIGAEFCPYCAAMRWPMAVALSRFGTFTTPLRGIHSSGSDVYPNTATLTFYQTGYTSRYLVFTPVENEKVDRSPLQATTPQQQALWDKYDPRSYPFIDFGNRYVIVAPIYDPQVLAGKTWSQITSALHGPSSPVAQGALGAANYITAAICKITGGQPSGVCSSRAVTRVQAAL
jgi:Domain of unknown function (DUF929)